MVVLMNAILTEGASCQRKGCFVLRVLPDSATSASDQCAYVRKAEQNGAVQVPSAHGKTALSAHGSSRRTKCRYLQRPDRRLSMELCRHHRGKAGCGIGTHAI